MYKFQKRADSEAEYVTTVAKIHADMQTNKDRMMG